MGATQSHLPWSLQLKRGDARNSIQVALQLVQSGHQIEVQHFGYTILQHVVGHPSCACMCILTCASDNRIIMHTAHPAYPSSHHMLHNSTSVLYCRWVHGGRSFQLRSIHSWPLHHLACSPRVCCSTGLACCYVHKLALSHDHAIDCSHALYIKLQNKPAFSNPILSSGCDTARKRHMCTQFCKMLMSRANYVSTKYM